MSGEAISAIACGSAGNVVSWDTLKKNGNSVDSVKAFPGCSGKSDA